MKKFGLFAIVCSLALTFAAVRLSSSHLFSSNIKVRRAEHLKDNFSIISQTPSETTLFVGNSIFQHFLDPKIFDQVLQKKQLRSVSYNVSMAGFMGRGMISLCNYIKAQSEKKKQKFRSIIFELSPVSYSKRYYLKHRYTQDVVNPSLFYESNLWLDWLSKDPVNGTSLILSMLLRPTTSSIFAYFNLGYPLKWPGMANFFMDENFKEDPEWNLATNGLSNWNFPKSKELFNFEVVKLHENLHWTEMIKNYSRGNGVGPKFQFSKRLVDDTISAMQICSQAADHTIALRLPYAPSFQKAAAPYADTSYVMNRVKNETNLTILDAKDDYQLTDEDFADAMHLKHETMNKFIADLAQKYLNLMLK